MSWGGRRRGAGAPRGNFNALKHGGSSQQLLALIEKLSQDPAFIRLVAVGKKRAVKSRPRPNGSHQRQLKKLGRALDLYMDVLGVNVGRSTQKARENARRLMEIVDEEQLRSRSNQNRKIDSFSESHYQGLEAQKPPPHSRRGPKNKKFVQVPVPTGIAMSGNQVEPVGKRPGEAPPRQTREASFN